MGSSSNRYAPRLPQQETKPSTKQLAPTDPILGPEHLLKTGFAQKGLPSCPSGRHKLQSFIETKTCASATLIQKTSKNEPKHGPKKWDRLAVPFVGPHAQLSKRTKEKHFHGPILRPSGGTKNETAKSQNPQQRPTLATNKNCNCIYLSNQHIDLEQRRPAHAKPDFN